MSWQLFCLVYKGEKPSRIPDVRRGCMRVDERDLEVVGWVQEPYTMSSVGRKPGRGRLWEGDAQSPLGTLLLLIFLPRSGGNGGSIYLHTWRCPWPFLLVWVAVGCSPCGVLGV